MTRWLIGFATFTVIICNTVEARDPYNPTGFPACAGGETGFWQFIVRDNPTKGEKPIVSLVLTSVDIPDPAFVICWVDGRQRVQAIGPEQQL